MVSDHTEGHSLGSDEPVQVVLCSTGGQLMLCGCGGSLGPQLDSDGTASGFPLDRSVSGAHYIGGQEGGSHL